MAQASLAHPEHGIVSGLPNGNAGRSYLPGVSSGVGSIHNTPQGPTIKAVNITPSSPMSLRDLARLGFDEIRAMWGRGELKREHLALAADGGQAWLAALAKGDITTPEAAMARATTCTTCPSHTRTTTDLTINGHPVVKLWCGKTLQPNTDGPATTCGCLMALIVGEDLIPAPKVWVASEQSSQGRWLPAPSS